MILSIIIIHSIWSLPWLFGYSCLMIKRDLVMNLCNLMERLLWLLRVARLVMNRLSSNFDFKSLGLLNLTSDNDWQREREVLNCSWSILPWLDHMNLEWDCHDHSQQSPWLSHLERIQVECQDDQDCIQQSFLVTM